MHALKLYFSSAIGFLVPPFLSAPALADIQNTSPIKQLDTGGAKPNFPEPESSYPKISGSARAWLQADYNFSEGDDRTAIDLRTANRNANFKLEFNPEWSFNLGLKLQQVTPNDPYQNDILKDQGQYIEAMNVRYESAGTRVIVGELDDFFTDAISFTYGSPKQLGQTLTSYRQYERLGADISEKFPASALGEKSAVRLGSRIFWRNTAFNQSIFHSRDPRTLPTGAETADPSVNLYAEWDNAIGVPGLKFGLEGLHLKYGDNREDSTQLQFRTLYQTDIGEGSKYFAGFELVGADNNNGVPHSQQNNFLLWNHVVLKLDNNWSYRAGISYGEAWGDQRNIRHYVFETGLVYQINAKLDLDFGPAIRYEDSGDNEHLDLYKISVMTALRYRF